MLMPMPFARTVSVARAIAGAEAFPNRAHDPAPAPDAAASWQQARRRLLALLLAAGGSVRATAQPQPTQQPMPPDKAPLQNYLYFHHRGDNGAALRDEPALRDRRFAGAQVAYSWRSLETAPGRYDLSAIEADLEWVRSLGKSLWVQLQEKSFTPRVNVPAYLLSDPRYGGGVLRQSMASAPERDKTQPLGADEYGWVPQMWLPAVRARYRALVRHLGQRMDGRIAGINFSESSIDIGEELPGGHTRYPKGFTPDRYVHALQENMRVLASAFRVSVPMVYLNFLPDEWMPDQDRGHMRGLFALAQALGMGVGGPDLTPFKKGPMSQSYPFFHAYPPHLFKAMAVQSGNLRQTNPRTGAPYTVQELLDFARDYLGLDLIFWGIEDPSFRNTVLPQLPP